MTGVMSRKGDHWFIVTECQMGKLRVRHEPHKSAASITETEIGDFLATHCDGPEVQTLRIRLAMLYRRAPVPQNYPLSSHRGTSLAAERLRMTWLR
jgi:hypothetical protein